jgi:hypothetical protein
LQHAVDQRPKIHLDCIEFTLKYRDGVRKVVDKLGAGLVNLNRCRMAMLRGTGTTANLPALGSTWSGWGDLTSRLTGIAAASAGLAPIGWV